MNQVLLTPRAEQDLEEIGDYIAAGNPSRARSFVQEIRTRIANLADSPLAHPRRQELGDSIRVCLHGRYVIIFSLASVDRVIVVRILHSSRDIPSVFLQTS